MRWKPFLTVGLVFAMAFFATCKFSNDERCPSGFFYVENLLSCCEEGNSIYHPETQRCHITEKSPSNCENQSFVFLSVTYVTDEGEQVSEEACCPKTMTIFNADECVAPIENETTTETSTDNDGPPTGIGEPCTVDGTDCEDFEAAYCLKHPLNQGDYCTLIDCANSAACGDDFTCCDCTGQTTLKPAIVGCLKDADAKLAKAFCDCEL